MSLKIFHIVFITCSFLLALGMLVYGGQNYRLSHDPNGLKLAIFGGIILLLLIPYIRWFGKEMKKLPVVLLPLLFVFSRDLQACAVCFGDPSSPMTKGIKAGILFLVGVIGVVLGTILGIGLKWSKKASQLPKE